MAERRYALSGTCFRGNGCTFAHSVTELCEVPDFQGSQPCFRFAKGTCRNGQRCKFAHGQQELRSARASMKETFAANQRVLEETSKNFETMRLNSLHAAQVLQATMDGLEILQVGLMMQQTAFDSGLPFQDGIQHGIQAPPGLPPPSIDDCGYTSTGQEAHPSTESLASSRPSSDPVSIWM